STSSHPHSLSAAAPHDACHFLPLFIRTGRRVISGQILCGGAGMTRGGNGASTACTGSSTPGSAPFVECELRTERDDVAALRRFLWEGGCSATLWCGGCAEWSLLPPPPPPPFHAASENGQGNAGARGLPLAPPRPTRPDPRPEDPAPCGTIGSRARWRCR